MRPIVNPETPLFDPIRSANDFTAAAQRLDLEHVVCGDYLDLLVANHERTHVDQDRRFQSYRQIPYLFDVNVEEYTDENARSVPYFTFDKPLIVRTGIHFEPVVVDADGELRQLCFETPECEKSVNERHQAVAKILLGNLSYVLMVESGAVDRPDVLITHSNATMCRLAKKCGFIRLSSLQERQLQEDDAIPRPKESEVEHLLDKVFEFENCFERTDEYSCLELVWLFTEAMRGVSNPAVLHMLKKLISTAVQYETDFVECDTKYVLLNPYTNFRDKVVSEYKRFGRTFIDRHLRQPYEAASFA